LTGATPQNERVSSSEISRRSKLFFSLKAVWTQYYYVCLVLDPWNPFAEKQGIGRAIAYS
jgi:hypothetical protein